MPAREKINIVWLKRDIRTQDHKALHAAEVAGLPYLIIYFFEPRLMAYPDTSLRHLQFIYHSIQDFDKKVKPFQRRVEVLHCEAVDAFRFIQSKYKIEQVFSYQESGTQITWDRDKAVAGYFKEETMAWTEFKKGGVIRGSKNRKGWEQRWIKTMNSPTLLNNFSHTPLPPLKHPFPINKHLKKAISKYPKAYQPAGEEFAWKYLHSFVADRGKNYHRHISKPAKSRISCGRISPYLAWGNISIKQAVQFIRSHPNYENNKRAFDGILSRLHWHCHFIQKFEVECAYETRCINQGYESLKRDYNKKYVEDWKNGQTGFPLVDACIRCLHHSGWINFRMRAMTVSLLCHHLDQDWRTGVYHFAKLFLDYEPGIHYPQFQMQAGTTGTNTVRIYNPIKNSQEHDPEGIFIKKWIPELREVPLAFIHEPSKMTALDQSFCGVQIGIDYPLPLVDLVISGRIARDKIWGHRKDATVQSEQRRIIKTHIKTGRKNSK